MAYTTSTPIKGASLGDPAAIAAWAKAKGCARPDDVAEYLDTLCRLCRSIGLSAHVLVAQSIHETADPDTGAPWASYWWQQRLNPAGIGITGDTAQNNASRTFADGAAAARGHALHMYLYAVGSGIPTGLSKSDDPRWQAAVDAGYAGIATTISDLTNRWGIDNQYAAGVAKWLNTLDQAGLIAKAAETPTTTASTTGDTAMATYTTTIPGLPGGPLTTLVPVRVKLIPAWRTLNRPGIKAESPRRSVQHGNGNPNSTAAGEATYLYNGADGRQASYHSSIDDREIWIMVPADEVTWQAADGAGPGNMCGYSCEMVEDAGLWADPARRAAVIRNTADFMGRVSARLGIAKPEQHWSFNAGTADRHDCPNKLRYVWIGGRLAWDIYVEYWQAAKADELRLMAGDDTGVPVTPPPTATYAKPVPIPELAGISIDQHDSVAGVVTRDGGDDFIFVADVVEAVRPTKRLQYASAGSPSVGPDLAVGERFVVTWLVKAADGQWYYVTPWWTRILRKDTKRIADAPIVPTETVAQAA